MKYKIWDVIQSQKKHWMHLRTKTTEACVSGIIEALRTLERNLVMTESFRFLNDQVSYVLYNIFSNDNDPVCMWRY